MLVCKGPTEGMECTFLDPWIHRAAISVITIILARSH